jgi:hypothetical protein
MISPRERFEITGVELARRVSLNGRAEFDQSGGKLILPRERFNIVEMEVFGRVSLGGRMG